MSYVGLVFHQNVARDSKSKHVLIKSSFFLSAKLEKSFALGVMPNPEIGKFVIHKCYLLISITNLVGNSLGLNHTTVLLSLLPHFL